MTSQLKVDRISPATGSEIIIDGFEAPTTPIKAWVNFNGTGTVSIRDSMNVSSITDNGIGNYTVNFSNPMSSADYSVATSTDPDLYNGAQHVAHITNSSPSGFDIYTKERRGGFADITGISAILAGN